MKVAILLSTVACAVAFALPAPFYIVSSAARALESVSHASNVPAPLQRRDSCAETCGSVCYYQTTIDAAVAAGYKLYKAHKQEGKYPHTENNYEGFDFAVSGPYQEYPVMSDFQAYDGGSPGADRVVFNTQGLLAGVVTHTGASGNDFVQCTDGSDGGSEDGSDDGSDDGSEDGYEASQ